MSQNTEAGDIRAGMQVIFKSHFHCFTVQGCKGWEGVPFNVFERQLTGAYGIKKNTRSQWLGEDKGVARLGAGICYDTVRMDNTIYAESVFGFLIINCMAANQ